MTVRECFGFVGILGALIASMWLYHLASDWLRLGIAVVLLGLIVVGERKALLQQLLLVSLKSCVAVIVVAAMLIAIDRFAQVWQLLITLTPQFGLMFTMPAVIVLGQITVQKWQLPGFGDGALIWWLVGWFMAAWPNPNTWAYWGMCYVLYFSDVWLRRKPGGVWLSLMLFYVWLMGMMCW